MMRHPVFVFKVLCFKTRCSAAERSVWARIQGGKLSERPIVRVLDDPVNKRFARRVRRRRTKLLGALSLVRFFGASKEMNKKSLFFAGCGFA